MVASMSDEREMTLTEWVNKLPEFHLAHKEFTKLEQENQTLRRESLSSALKALDEIQTLKDKLTKSNEALLEAADWIGDIHPRRADKYKAIAQGKELK